MKNDNTINANATIIMMPIHVGTVASFVMMSPVALDADVAVPEDVPSLVLAVFNSCRTIKPIARTIATVTIERINPCNPPTCPFFRSFIYCRLPMKKLNTMKARATMMIIPIHVGTVAILVIIEAVATLALVS